MEQSKALLKMEKMILEGGTLDETVYKCEVLKYDNKEESIYLLLTEADITDISRDGIYRCLLIREDIGLACEGRVTDRYTNYDGNVLKFQIDKGFYKINIKSVDKEEME